MKTVKTKKGTELPLVNLKGKDYLQVAYRIQWFTEEVSNFDITTDFVLINDEQTVCRATIKVMDEANNVIRKATATKRETKKDFSDHTEKAETGAIGRALVELGYGTQFALSDLDEGDRLADSPLASAGKKAENKALASAVNLASTTTTASTSVATVQASGAQITSARSSSFRRGATQASSAQQAAPAVAAKTAPVAAEANANSADDWQ